MQPTLKLSRAALIASMLASSAFAPLAHALVDLSSGRVTFDSSVSETYDSHMVGAVGKGSDTITAFSPKLTYNHLIGPTGFTAFTGMSFQRYNSNSRLNSNDFSAGVSSAFPLPEGSRLTGNISAGYAKSTEEDLLLNDRIPTRSFSVGLNGEYKLGLKTSLSDSLNLNQGRRDIYGNRQLWSNNVRFSYRDFLEDTTLNVGHIYSRTKSDAADYSSWAYGVYDPTLFPNSRIDQYSNTFSAGVSHPLYGQIIGELSYGYTVVHRLASETRSGDTNETGNSITATLHGPLLPPSRFPKIESSASFSYSESQSLGINDTGRKTLTGNADIAWNARERTRLSIGASRSTGLGSNNFTIETTNVHFGVTEKIGLSTQVSATTRYEWLKQRALSRKDEEFSFDLNVNHALNQHWSLGATYGFHRRNTNAEPGEFLATRYLLEDYTRHVVSGFVSFSY